MTPDEIVFGHLDLIDRCAASPVPTTFGERVEARCELAALVAAAITKAVTDERGRCLSVIDAAIDAAEDREPLDGAFVHEIITGIKGGA